MWIGLNVVQQLNENILGWW